MGPWLHAGMVFSLTLRLRPGTQSRGRFFVRTAAGSLQSEHELTPRTEFIALLATGWHFVLLKDRPTQQHLQHRDLLKALATWEWLTLRSSGTVSPGADVERNCYMQ